MYFKWNDNVALGGADEFYNRDTDIWALDLMITPNENHAIELFGGYVNTRTGYPVGHNMGYWMDGMPLTWMSCTRTSALWVSATPARSPT